jgi:hypothetical protein
MRRLRVSLAELVDLSRPPSGGVRRPRAAISRSAALGGSGRSRFAGFSPIRGRIDGRRGGRGQGGDRKSSSAAELDLADLGLKSLTIGPKSQARRRGLSYRTSRGRRPGSFLH